MSGLAAGCGGHGSVARAIEVRRAFDLERELDVRQLRVEAVRRLVAAGAGAQMQRVAREVAEHRGADHERARQVVDAIDQRGVGARRQVVGGGHPFDGNRREPLAAVDQHVAVRARSHRRWSERAAAAARTACAGAAPGSGSR